MLMVASIPWILQYWLTWPDETEPDRFLATDFGKNRCHPDSYLRDGCPLTRAIDHPLKLIPKYRILTKILNIFKAQNEKLLVFPTYSDLQKKGKYDCPEPLLFLPTYWYKTKCAGHN